MGCRILLFPYVIQVKEVGAVNRELVNNWYEEYKTGIFRYALSILKDHHLAEDVLRETFVRLLSGKYAVHPGKEQAWLYKVAHNLCCDILRKRSWETGILEEPQDRESYLYIELIAPLDHTEREIVTLKIVGGLTHREIARVMGLTVHGSRKRYERAIQKLREGMQ